MQRTATIIILALSVAAIAAACSSAGGTSPSPAAPGDSTNPGASAATRIEVTLSDAMRIEPSAMTVPAGVPVTFVVTNAGSIEHEFYLGDDVSQDEHEQEMTSMGGMTHDEPAGIALEPGETKELTYTFTSPGRTIAGCHVVGHYGAGMKADITVED